VTAGIVGSIYDGLHKMAEEGLLKASHGKEDTLEGTRYSVTRAGRDAFARGLRELWFTHRPAKDPMQVALTFMDRMEKGELLGALRRREALLEQELGDLALAQDAKLSAPGVPRHIAENLQLSALHAQAEREWVRDAIVRVERGQLP
jgi:DNA-binding PadR family transcriptional regulator